MNKKIQELNKELEKLQARIKEVQDRINEVKREETWPNFGDYYWFIDCDGNVTEDIMECMIVDDGRRSIGNIFRTEKEAQFEREHLKVIAELKRFAMRSHDWQANRYHGERYYIYLSGKGEIKINRAAGFVHSTLYFESPEKVKEAIAAVGEVRIKKYYFEVDEE